jgi:isopropylmalate/homocitrate/citramalate synthase
VQEWCEKLKVQASEEEMLAMVRLIKEKSFEKKDLLTEDEFKAIVDRVLKKAAAAS